MDERLDSLVERLAALPTDRSLDHFDADVDRGRVRWEALAHVSRALAPVNVASVGLALAIGLTVGGATAAASVAVTHPPVAFPVASELAPSTLLEGGR